MEEGRKLKQEGSIKCSGRRQEGQIISLRRGGRLQGREGGGIIQVSRDEARDVGYSRRTEII